jgi:hypothetical protein
MFALKRLFMEAVCLARALIRGDEIDGKELFLCVHDSEE